MTASHYIPDQAFAANPGSKEEREKDNHESLTIHLIL